MKTIEEIKEELKATAGYGSHVLTMTIDGKGEPLVLYFSDGNDVWAQQALHAAESLGLLLMQLETATSRDDAKEVIRQAAATMEAITSNVGEFVPDDYNEEAKRRLMASCDKFALDYSALEKEADEGDYYEPLA
jgi:hypothetical protein